MCWDFSSFRTPLIVLLGVDHVSVPSLYGGETRSLVARRYHARVHASLTKYNGILLCVSAVTFFASGSSNDRRRLLDWRLAGAGVIAFMVFAPVILWNIQHHWASFSFQLHHGFAGTQNAWWLIVLGRTTRGGRICQSCPLDGKHANWNLCVEGEAER